MEQVRNQLLRPLLKWRILDLEGLQQELTYQVPLMTLYKHLVDFEKEGVVVSKNVLRDRRKYFYLSNLGLERLGHKKSLGLIDEFFTHDLKVTQVVRQLLRSPNFTDVKFENELGTGTFIPDSELKFNYKERTLILSLEMELSRKSKERILSKAEFYLSSSYYDLVLYIFPSHSLMRSYYKVFQEKLGSGFNQKLLLMANENLMAMNFDLAEAKGFYQGHEVLLGNVFPIKKTSEKLEKIEKMNFSSLPTPQNA